jgi:hypothetical protein
MTFGLHLLATVDVATVGRSSAFFMGARADLDMQPGYLLLEALSGPGDDSFRGHPVPAVTALVGMRF